MTTERPLGAELAMALKARGVDTVFGIPGVHNVELYRGLASAGLTHVLARHEQGVGFMADGYARATGKPGVAFVITGPGLCNIMTPLGQAYTDSVPLLAISTCLDRGDLNMGGGRLHEMKNQEAAGETVTAWSRTALDANGAYTLLDRAFAGFSGARPRPVHMQVPIDVLGAGAPPAPHPRAQPALPRPDAGLVAKAADVLGKAKKPMLLLGGGAVAGAEAARTLTARLGIAVFPTYAGRGIVPDDNPMSFGAYLARSEAVPFIASADLLIAVGTEFSETDYWRPTLGHECSAIRCDIDPLMLSALNPEDLAVQGDAAAFLEALVDATTDLDRRAGWDDVDIPKARQTFRASSEAERPGIPAVGDTLKAALPDDVMVFSDMTQIAYTTKETWPMDRPAHWHHPYGFGTLGYALPAAIGAKVGRPDAPIVAMAGDYGFQYTLQDLAVAVELKQGLPIILWDNDGLGQIEVSMQMSQIAPTAVRPLNPDFLALARAYGAHAVEPASAKELPAIFEAAFGATAPTLVRLTPRFDPT